jgi:hypothetical protein
MLSSVDVSIEGVVTVAHNVEHRRVLPSTAQY